MDKALKRRLRLLRIEHDDFHHSRIEKRENADALIRAYYSVPPRFRTGTAPPRYEWESWPEHLQHLRFIPCGATTRTGTPCKITTTNRGGPLSASRRDEYRRKDQSRP